MKTISTHTISDQAGIGLRAQHIQQVLDEDIGSLWLELLVDNWLADGGLTRHYLDAISERYPMTLHGVGLSLGGVDPLDFDYLIKIKNIMQCTDALCYSEHLCFSQLSTYYSHDLLPLPYTDETVLYLVERINQVQDFLGHQLIIENVSSYLEYKVNILSEGEFIKAIAEESGCGLLLDVNNFYVNQINHGQNAWEQIRMLPPQSIKEIHLAGFANKGDYVIDAHNSPVTTEVWALYKATLSHVGNVATLIEWDNDLPSLDILLAERDKAQYLLDQYQRKQQCA